MERVNQTISLGVSESVYHERRTPSVDASSVARWVISPAILAFFFTGALTAGLGLAGTASSTFGFVAGLFMFGGGLGGNMMILVRAITFDKQPAVVITERTPIVHERQADAQTLGGNRPVMVPTTNLHTVEHRGHKYDFSTRQCRLMIDRIEDGNFAVARDAFEIESTAYSDVRYIMGGVGYWAENGRGVEWTDTGARWLEGQMRQINL